VTTLSDVRSEHDDGEGTKRRIRWFGEADATELMASGVMTAPAMTPEMTNAYATSPIHEGVAVRVLFQDNSPDGFSLVHAWFGEDYPLPRHTHSADCMYYVLKGELRMGAKTIHSGEGLLIPAGRPYTYRAGPGGAEVLEFRTTSSFDMQILDKDPARWQAFAATAVAMAPVWIQTRPDWAQAFIASGA